MKTIGRTNEGLFLVEMTGHEHETFRILYHALSGTTLDYGFFDDGDSDRFCTIEKDEIGHVFVAIRRWAQSCFQVNRMQAVVDELRSLMEPVAVDGGD